MLDEQERLSTADRTRLVTTVAKLGFWNSVLDIVPADGHHDSADAMRMMYFRHYAEAQIASNPRSATAALERARGVTESMVRSPDLGPAGRRRAAAHMIVLYAKEGRTDALARMRPWLHLANELSDQASAAVDPLHESTYWRAVAFVPFFEKNHIEVERHLKLAETFAFEAVNSANEGQRLSALENVYPVLETSGRSAKARGDKDTAERFYRRMTEWDPLDPRGQIRLADFLYQEGRMQNARDHYRFAARLGAPYTSYAHYQAARCSIELDQDQQALSALVASASTDRRALTPLILLRDRCVAASLSPLRQWAASELVRRMRGFR